jgi:hypothetical protein
VGEHTPIVIYLIFKYLKAFTMVTIVDYSKRVNSEGKEFNVLILQGGLELVKSQQTGRYYATAKKASLSSTFTEDLCKTLIGQKLPGAIMKVECEPYEFTVPETGEILNLNHRWEYLKEESSIEETVFEGSLKAAHA